MFARVNYIRQRLVEAFTGDKTNVSQSNQFAKERGVSKRSQKSTNGSRKSRASLSMFSKAQERALLMAAPAKITTNITAGTGAGNDVDMMEIADSIETSTPSGKQSQIYDGTSNSFSGRIKRSTPGAVANIARALTPVSFDSTDDEAADEDLEDDSPVEVEDLVRKEYATEEDHPHWSKAERDLFNKLNSRGFEPLLPTCWELDFPTMPLDLFSLDDEKCYLKSLSGNNFRAIRALRQILPLGAQVRNRIAQKLEPEPLIARAINQYIKWSIEDAGLDRCDYVPCIAVAARVHGEEDATAVYHRMEMELRQLAAQYWHEFRAQSSETTPSTPAQGEKNGQNIQKAEVSGSPKPTFHSTAASTAITTFINHEFNPELPTLYGLIVAHSIVALVTLDTSVSGKQLRNLALVDFNKSDQDVWNSVAIAMVAIWARDYLRSLGWKENEGNREQEEDPDA